MKILGVLLIAFALAGCPDPKEPKQPVVIDPGRQQTVTTPDVGELEAEALASALLMIAARRRWMA